MELAEFNETHIEKWHDIFEFVNENSEEQNGLYYLLKSEQSERVVYKSGDFFALFYFVDEEIYYNMFIVNENGNVVAASFEEFNVLKPSSLITIEHEESMIETVDLLKSDMGPKFDGYDGIFQYSQYNNVTDEQLILYFQHMIREDGKVFEQHLVNPYLIVFQRNLSNGKIKSTTYAKNEIDSYKSKSNYDLLTIQEYGLVEFLKSGSYALQKEDKVVRYHKVLMETQNTLVTAFPFTAGSKIEEMNAMIEAKGFKHDVPDYAVRLWNGTYEELNYYQEIADLFNGLEINQNEKLVLRYGKS